jgi:hypothetical protein
MNEWLMQCDVVVLTVGLILNPCKASKPYTAKHSWYPDQLDH